MKTILILNNTQPLLPGVKTKPFPESEIAYTYLPDSSLSNSKKPFFIPDFSNDFECLICPAYKITRLGKTINPRFSHRYTNEMTLAVLFYSPTHIQKLTDNGHPISQALSFDKALYLGEWTTKEEFAEISNSENFSSPSKMSDIYELSVSSYGMEYDEDKTESQLTLQLFDGVIDINRIISEVSYCNTLKTGDIIIPTLPRESAFKISKGQDMVLTKTDKEILRIPIR